MKPTHHSRRIRFRGLWATYEEFPLGKFAIIRLIPCPNNIDWCELCPLQHTHELSLHAPLTPLEVQERHAVGASPQEVYGSSHRLSSHLARHPFKHLSEANDAALAAKRGVNEESKVDNAQSA
jgi:hypothetical protein